MRSPLLRLAKVLAILLLMCLPTWACTVQDASVRDRNWVRLGVGVGSRMYLDSSRVEIADHGHIVWLWVDFTEPSKTPVDTTLFWGVQTRHHLLCAAQLAGDLELLRRLDRQGAQFDTVPFEGTRWKTFEDHPLGRNLFPLACQWLSRHRPARG
jgi:hypothetical protein